MKRFLCLLIPLLGLAMLAGPATSAKVDPFKKRCQVQVRTVEFAEEQVQQPKADPPKVDPVPAPKPKGPNPKFKTGARRTPLPKIVEALRTGKASVHKARNKIPASVAMVPKTLSMLGNDQYGDCVTAESCAAIESYSTYVGLPEIVITDQAAIDFASAHGGLNGADLLTVIQQMEADGVKDSNGTLRKAGTPATVDYTNEATLRSAVALGPVSIAIGSGDLPSGAGSENGWYALTSNGAANDHCVGLWGYGTAEELFKALGMPCPAECAGKTGYLLYTWRTIGFVTHAWIVGTVQEAWVRNPTTVGLTPPTPPPPPPILTVAVADATGIVGSAVQFLPIASGGTGPYSFTFDYGDGASDATGSHTYTTAGAYKVSVGVTDSKGQTGSGTCTATVTQSPVPPPTGGKLIVTDTSITVPLGLPNGSFTPIEDATLQMSVGDFIRMRSMRLTPPERQVLQQLLDRLNGKK